MIKYREIPGFEWFFAVGVSKYGRTVGLKAHLPTFRNAFENADVAGARKLRADEQVWRNPEEMRAPGPTLTRAGRGASRLENLLHGGTTTRSVDPGIPTETVGASGRGRRKLRTDDQV